MKRPERQNGQEAVWNWMLLLPSRRCPLNPHKGPKSPSTFEPVFQNERRTQWRVFSYPSLFSTERSRGRGERKRSFRTSFPLLPFTSLVFFRALNHLLEEKANFLQKFLEFFPFFVPFQPRAMVSEEAEGKKAKEGGRKEGKGSERLRWKIFLKKKGEHGKKRGERLGQLLEGLVRDFQPLTSVAASSATPNRHKDPRRPLRARSKKGDGRSLILWRNCLQVGPSIPQWSWDKERLREKDEGA